MVRVLGSSKEYSIFGRTTLKNRLFNGLFLFKMFLLSFFVFNFHASFAESISYGSGVLISQKGHLVTNYHVIENAENITVYVSQRAYLAKVVKIDKVNDLAILQISGAFPYLHILDSNNVKLGDEVWAIGFPNPDVQGFSIKVSNGIISSLAGMRDDPRHFQITNSIQPGNSGGPIVSKNGEIVGIVFSTLSPFYMANIHGSIPQNVNYAIKASQISSLLGGCDLLGMSDFVL